MPAILQWSGQRWRHLVWIASGLLVLIWGAGLIGFVAASGQFRVSMPRLQQPPVTDHDVAAALLGPTVRASSFFTDWTAHNHPLFLFDRRDNPTVVEKWASDPGDVAPWVEVRWREQRHINRVVIRHGGSVEAPATSVRNYRVICLRDGPGDQGGGRPGASLSIRDNVDAVAVHQLDCEGAWGVRLEFERPVPGDIVRVYELEAWGQ